MFTLGRRVGYHVKKNKLMFRGFVKGASNWGESRKFGMMKSTCVLWGLIGWVGGFSFSGGGDRCVLGEVLQRRTIGQALATVFLCVFER